MRAVLFIPMCCKRAKYAADGLRLGIRERMAIDRWLCGTVNHEVAVEEIARRCQVLYSVTGLLGYMIVVECAEWEDVEEIVFESGGAVVYV